MDTLKKVGEFLFRHKKKIIPALIVLIFLIILASSVYFITIDYGTWDDDEVGRPSTYTNNVKISTEDGKSGLVIDKDLIIKQALIDMGYTEEQIADLTEKDIISILDFSKKLGKTVNSLEDCTNAEILWCISDAYSEYLDNPEELEKLLNAEIITQYPKIGDENSELDGIIEFERHQTDGTTLMLKYINLETFNKYIEEKNTDIVKYFTLDENGNVLIGIVDETNEEFTTNDSEIVLSNYTETLSDSDKTGEGSYSKIEYSVYSKAINYKSMISKYTMPFQYLWSFIVIGDDKGIGLELADLVEDSQIVFSIYDNITTTVNTSTYTYNKERKVDVSATVTATTNYGGYASDSDNWTPADEWQLPDNYEVKQIYTYKNNTPIVDLTKADVWIVDYSKEYTYQASQQTSQETNEKDLEDTEYIGDSENPINSNSDGSDLPEYNRFRGKISLLRSLVENTAINNSDTSNILVDSDGEEIPLQVNSSVSSSASYYTHEINKHRKDVSTVSSQKYVAGNVISNPKVDKKTKEEIKNGTGQDNFVTILCKKEYIEARKKITSEITSWLFELLETNQDTVNMVDLTKYLLYKVTGRDFGVKEYDFDEYLNNDFSVINNIYGSNFEEKVWFALIDAGFSEYSVAGAMGNFQQESGFKANNLQNTFEKNLGMTDETYTEAVNNGTYTNFVHDSAGYGLAQWTFWSRKQGLLNYTKEKGVGIDDEEAQIGFLINEINKRGCPKWKAATSVEDACYYFEKEFEQAGKPAMGNRLTYAENIYNRYHGQTAPIDVEVKLSGDSKTKMEALLKEAQRIANDNRYTYSQTNRFGEFQYDCSSFVYRLYKKFFNISVPLNTAGYDQSCRVGSASSVKLQPGDVLWRSGHVTLYIGNGKYAAAHGCEGKLANNPAAQISVYNDSPSNYTYVYRFINN